MGHIQGNPRWVWAVRVVIVVRAAPAATGSGVRLPPPTPTSAPPSPPGGPSMFARLGTWCHDRRGRVLIMWVVALIVIGGVAGAMGPDFKEDFSGPDVESATGLDILNEHFGGEGAGLTGTIVFRAEQGVDDPEVRDAMTALFEELDARDDLSVDSPYEEGNQFKIASAGADAGLIAYADIEMPEDT